MAPVFPQPASWGLGAGVVMRPLPQGVNCSVLTGSQGRSLERGGTWETARQVQRGIWVEKQVGARGLQGTAGGAWLVQGQVGGPTSILAPPLQTPSRLSQASGWGQLLGSSAEGAGRAGGRAPHPHASRVPRRFLLCEDRSGCPCPRAGEGFRGGHTWKVPPAPSAGCSLARGVLLLAFRWLPGSSP